MLAGFFSILQRCEVAKILKVSMLDGGRRQTSTGLRGGNIDGEEQEEAGEEEAMRRLKAKAKSAVKKAAKKSSYTEGCQEDCQEGSQETSYQDRLPRRPKIAKSPVLLHQGRSEETCGDDEFRRYTLKPAAPAFDKKSVKPVRG